MSNVIPLTDSTLRNYCKQLGCAETTWEEVLTLDSGHGLGCSNGQNTSKSSSKSTGSSNDKKEEMKFVPFQKWKGSKRTFDMVKIIY